MKIFHSHGITIESREEEMQWTFSTLVVLVLSQISFGCSSVNKRTTQFHNKNNQRKINLDGNTRIPAEISIKTAFKSRKLLRQLSIEREKLLQNNLFDTGVDSSANAKCKKLMKNPHRTPDGQCYFHGLNDFPGKMRMGDNNQRFGRNVSPEYVEKASKYSLTDPNPLELSRKLLTRKGAKTIEAKSLNVLAVAWLQAQNHDWFSHGKNQKKQSYVIKDKNNKFSKGMKIPKTARDKTSLQSRGYQKTFRNHVTHWWDASHIYGSNQQTINKIRTRPSNIADGDIDSHGFYKGGKIAVNTKKRKLYYDRQGLPITGFNDNWWLGLELIHSLFAMEHNYIADKLKEKYPQMDDETIFQKSRLIISAIIAKIHTVEWTPALLDNEALRASMQANWYGFRSLFNINSPFLRKILGSLSPSMKHAFSGLVGPETLDLYGVPFSLTEEFVAVYRMHSLIPEKITIRNVANSNIIGKLNVKDTVFRNVSNLVKSSSEAVRLMYSFGTSHPGALALHNYPSFMQNLKAERNMGRQNSKENTSHFDMAAVDIFRDRERLVPRYNDFRRALRESLPKNYSTLSPIKRFEDLTDNPEDIQILKDIYGHDSKAVEKLDLLIGTLAEKDRFSGFAFGNTPFYIFTLMASRRLMADPFYSNYFTNKIYTDLGMNYVQKTTMKDILVRHYPELESKFNDIENIFGPWNHNLD